MKCHQVTAVLLLISCVAAVFLEDAFVTDWVHYNYKDLVRSWLVDSSSIVALTGTNRLVSLDAESKELSYVVELNRLGYTDTSDLEVVGLETSFIAYLKQKPQILVFAKNSGVLTNIIELEAAPKQVRPLSKDAIAFTDERGSLYAWNNGELGVLASFCKSFTVFVQDGVDNVLADGQILQLTPEDDGLEVNNVDVSALKTLILTESDIIIDLLHGLSTSGNKVTLLYQEEEAVQVLWSQEYVLLVTAQVHRTGGKVYLVVVTSSAIYSYDVTKLLKNHKKSFLNALDITYNGDFAGAFIDESSLSVLSSDPNAFELSNLSFGSKKTSVFTIPKVEAHMTDKAILVDYPASLSVMDKAHHMLEDSSTKSDLVRWLRRIKSHLAQFGRAAVSVASKSPLSIFQTSSKTKKNAICRHGTAREEDADAIFENEKYGFDKVLVTHDSINKAVVAKSTFEGCLLWIQPTHTDDILVDLLSVNAELYVVFKHKVLVLLLRTGEILHERNFLAEIENALRLKTVEDVDEGLEPFTIAFRSGSDLVTLFSESTLAANQYLVLQTDAHIIKGFKLVGTKLVETWKFGNSDETIVSLSNMEGGLTTAVGIARGDRSLLYKYLNPNLITVVTKEGKTIKVTLIDGVTGSTLHAQRHDGEIVDIQSINVVQADNWVIYTYQLKYPTVEQRIVVIDLFTTAENAIGTNKSTLSGEYDVSIAQLSVKSFIYPERILQLAATKTKFGITVRSIIALTESGQLVDIPKFFLNSRRIDDRKMTASDFADEFKLMPYEPLIMHNTYQVLNHKVKLETSDKSQYILIEPTDFESTAIVCFVNDENEFCTTIQPSLSYDRLTLSFDRFKLVITIGALFMIYMFTKPMVESKKLSLNWLD